MSLRNPPEKEFILSCLQSIHCSRARTRCTGTIANTLDWNRIFNTATRAKISSLFFHQLRFLGLGGSIPTHIRRQFEKYYYKVGYRNSLIINQTIQLIQMMAEANVDVLILKGIALQVHVWRNLSLREMADVDLLVRSEDLEKAENILLNDGYLPIENFRPAEYYRRSHHHLVPYYHPKAAYRIPVEIHHNIAQPKDPQRLPMEDFWRTALEVEFDGLQYRVLSPENLLMHLCIQMAFVRNFLGQIRYCLDISQTVARFGSDVKWDNVVETARRYGITNYIYYSLYFSKCFAGASIPQAVLGPMRAQVSAKYVSHRMLCFLVQRYILWSFPDKRLIPDYKLCLFIRDILADAGFSKRFATIWNEVPVIRRLKIGTYRNSIPLLFA